MFRYHTTSNVSDEEFLSTEQQQRRERSLSPDSLEQRLLKQQMLFDDDVDDESFLSSSPSFIDSINIDAQQRHSNSTKTILKTLTSHGLFSAWTFTNGLNNDLDDEIDDDDDLDDIHIDQDEVNLLFSDPDDGGILCRLSGEMIGVDDDYDDDNDDFRRHIRPLSLVTSSNLIIPSLISVHDQDIHPQQYSSYHFLDPISEAASEEERRAAISIIRQQQPKHKHSTSSSLSISANGHCDGDTTTNEDLSTLSDIDEQNTSMDEVSLSSPRYSEQHQQHIHKKRRHTDVRSRHWLVKNESKLTRKLAIDKLNSIAMILNTGVVKDRKDLSIVCVDKKVLGEVYIEIITRCSKHFLGFITFEFNDMNK